MSRGKRTGKAAVPRDGRTDGVDVRFTPAEVRDLAKMAEAEDRSLSGFVHWVMRGYLRGDLAWNKSARPTQP